MQVQANPLRTASQYVSTLHSSELNLVHKQGLAKMVGTEILDQDIN